MSMKPQAIPEIPAEIVRVVCAVFSKGNIYVLRDTLGSIYEDWLEAASLFYSPYDLDADVSKKRSTY